MRWFKVKSIATAQLSHFGLALHQVIESMYYLPTISQFFLLVKKLLLNVGLSSEMLLTEWFLIKTCIRKSDE